MLTACALTGSILTMPVPFPLHLSGHVASQPPIGLSAAYANETSAPQIYNQVFTVETHSPEIREVEVNMSAWTALVAERYDGNEIQVIFDLYAQAPEWLEAIDGPTISSPEGASTLRVDLLYDGECLHHSYHNGVVTAAADICLHRVKVLIPRNRDIKVYQLYYSQPTRQLVDFSAPVIYDYSEEL